MLSCNLLCGKMSEDILELKQARNLFSALTRNENINFYGADEIPKTLIGKIKTSDYEKERLLSYIEGQRKKREAKGTLRCKK